MIFSKETTNLIQNSLQPKIFHLALQRRGERWRRSGVHTKPLHDCWSDCLPRNISQRWAFSPELEYFSKDQPVKQRWGHPLHPMGGVELFRGVLLLLHHHDNYRVWRCSSRFGLFMGLHLTCVWQKSSWPERKPIENQTCIPNHAFDVISRCVQPL